MFRNVLEVILRLLFPFLPCLVEGIMCLVKWGSDKLVVYTTNKGIHYMGLYQVRL